MKLKFSKLLACIFLCASLFNCKTVLINKNDKTPPELAMGAFTQGLENKAIAKSNAMPSKMLVASNEKVFWLANASDKSGLKKLEIEVVSGGLLNFDNRLLQKVEKENDTSATGISKTGILISGKLQFDSPTSKVILKSKATDWAGNVTFTPTVTVERIPKPVARLSANTTRINRGQSVTLTYETRNANRVFINTSQLNTLNGQKTVNPSVTTDYILKAENEVGITTDTIRIHVTQPPAAPRINSFTVNDTSVEKGDQVTLRWNTSNTNQVQLFQDNRLVHTTNSSGSKRIRLQSIGTVNFKLEASNGTQQVTKRVSVRVDPDTNCFSYPFAGNFSVLLRDRTRVLYRYPPSNLYQGQRITSVKNPFNVDVILRIGTRETRINAGQTTNFFNGLGVGSEWRLLVPNPQPTFVKINVCTERN